MMRSGFDPSTPVECSAGTSERTEEYLTGIREEVIRIRRCEEGSGSFEWEEGGKESVVSCNFCTASQEGLTGTLAKGYSEGANGD